MAVTKLMHMKQSSVYSNKAQHLYNSIDYIQNPHKTQDGLLVRSHNCMVNTAYQEMIAVKRQFEKEDGRQGYHFVISFKQGEVSADLALEITGRVVEEYLGGRYQVLYSVHDDQPHMHGHIVFNSVSCLDGLKYHYKDGDWERNIQPLVNKITKEYGLSYISLDALDEHEKEKNLEDETLETDKSIKIEETPSFRNKSNKGKHYAEWKAEQERKPTWRKLIKEAVDDSISKSSTIDEFIEQLKEKGYAVKYGKHISVRPEGKERFIRLKSLGEEYTEEAIWKEMISKNSKNTVIQEEKTVNKSPYIKVKRYGKRKKQPLSKLQRKYIRKLYRTGKIKKKYQNPWKYKKDVLILGSLQKQYNYLSKNSINSYKDLVQKKDLIESRDIELTQKRIMVYKKYKPLKAAFGLLREYRKLSFEPQMEAIKRDIKKRYDKSIDELESLYESYQAELDSIKKEKKEIFKEEKIIEKVENQNLDTVRRIKDTDTKPDKNRKEYRI